jgi:hypothetical protein
VSAFAPPAPSLPPDSEPLPATLPGIGLWGDSDVAGHDSFRTTVSMTPTAPATVVPMPADAEKTIGHIGRYRLKSLIGEGGLGNVYAAQDPLLSRTIAIKTLNLQVPEAERQAFNALFLNEARAAAGLSHPNIVTVFDAGISDQRAYIAMELLKGKDLRQLRAEGWRVSPAKAALLVRRVADALAYAHAKGVVHCDVKPANIFMVGSAQPRVLDFGIARIARRDATAEQEAIAAGSPYYMAPEQVRGDAIDRRVDVFSLGVVLYELLTDQRPFTGRTLAEITRAVVDTVPRPAHEVDATVPRGLSDIAAKAMEKDPELRFRSAKAFSRELRQWLEEHAVDGDPGHAAGTGDAAARRGGLAVATLAVLAGAALGAGVLWAALRPAAAPEAAPVVAVAQVVATTPVAAVVAAEATPAPVAATAALPAAAPPVDSGATPAAPAAVAAAHPPAPTAGPAEALADALREPRRTTRAAAEPRVGAEPRAVAAAVQTGLLRLAVTPVAQLEVDGVPVGSTPPLTELSLKEGRHQITLRHPDHGPFTTTVNVTGREPVTLRHRFGG